MGREGLEPPPRGVINSAVSTNMHHLPTCRSFRTPRPVIAAGYFIALRLRFAVLLTLFYYTTWQGLVYSSASQLKNDAASPTVMYIPIITSHNLQYIDQATPISVLFGLFLRYSSIFGLNFAILVFYFLGRSPPFFAAEA